MKHSIAAVLLAGAFVVGGTATAGPDERVWICHFPATGHGEEIEVSRNAWRTSPHIMHGDCALAAAYWIEDPDTGDEYCSCTAPLPPPPAPPEEEPAPAPPEEEPTPAPPEEEPTPPEDEPTPPPPPEPIPTDGDPTTSPTAPP